MINDAGHAALIQLAEAVAIGSDIDWVKVESSTSDPGVLVAIEQLKIVSQVASVCRPISGPIRTSSTSPTD
jgi:hypothetical protein